MVTLGPGASELRSDDPVIIAEPRLISCSHEELVELELEALRQGSERASADGAMILRDTQAVMQAAKEACERALAEQYIPLDQPKFREVFTLAWCAGYRAQMLPHPSH
jgi:hypothetical protein